jgi:hypothetical protein
MKWILRVTAFIAFEFFLSLVLMACGTSRAQQMTQERMNNLHVAQTLWNECAVDPNCTGDEMFKARAQLTDAQASVDRLNAARAQYAAHMDAVAASTDRSSTYQPLYSYQPAQPMYLAQPMSVYTPPPIVSGLNYGPAPDPVRHGSSVF